MPKLGIVSKRMNNFRYFSRFVQRLQVSQHAPERIFKGKFQLNRRQQQRQQAHQDLYRVSPLARWEMITSPMYRRKRRLAQSPFVQQAYEKFLHSPANRLSPSMSSTKRPIGMLGIRRIKPPLSSLHPSTMYYMGPKKPQRGEKETQVQMRQTRRHRVMSIENRQLLRKHQRQGQVKTRGIQCPPSHVF